MSLVNQACLHGTWTTVQSCADFNPVLVKFAELKEKKAASPLVTLMTRTPIHLLIAACFLTLDFFCGPFVQFPIAFVIPVALAGWFSRPANAYAFAIVQPLIRLSFSFFWETPWTITSSIINCLIRIGVLMFIAYLVIRTSRQTRQLAKEINLLEGILPICCVCKKIRDEHQNWEPIETYISQRSEANFSHGFCPECAHRHFGDIFDETGRPLRQTRAEQSPKNRDESSGDEEGG